jgi:hypothetical protein
MDQNSRHDIEEQGGVAVVMIYEGQQQWTGEVTPFFFGETNYAFKTCLVEGVHQGDQRWRSERSCH